MESFAIQLKEQLLDEFSRNDRKGVYSFTQKMMAYNSNKIEGSTLTSEQTASLFDTGTIVGDEKFIYRAKDIEEMNGHFKMFNEALKSLDKTLTSDIIKSYHYQLKSGVFEDYANGYKVGEFKDRVNQVSDIITELPQNIPSRIEEIVSNYNNSSRTLMDIVMFHAEYEHIHPFQDGNGRTGRAIMLKQCLDSNIIPIIISDNKKALYYHALHTAQTQRYFNDLMEFFLEEQSNYFEQVKNYVIKISDDKQIR